MRHSVLYQDILDKQSWLFSPSNAQNPPLETSGVFLFLCIPTALVESLVALHQTQTSFLASIYLCPDQLTGKLSEAHSSSMSCPVTQLKNATVKEKYNS